jgi:hypothetical protein
MKQANYLVIGLTVLVAGCVAAPPTGPSVMALPAQGKTFEQFQHDDMTCRQYASYQTGGAQPAQAAQDSAVTSAVVGTVIGAAAGAAIGAAAGNPAAGAAIGAGTGLAFGGVAGSGAAYASAAGLQHQYDMSYLQCMAANGESVPSTQGSQGGYYGGAYGGYYGYGYPYYGYYYPYRYY